MRNHLLKVQITMALLNTLICWDDAEGCKDSARLTLLLNFLQRYVYYLLILRLFALPTAYFGLIHAQLSLGCAFLAFKASGLLLVLTIDLLYENL